MSETLKAIALSLRQVSKSFGERTVFSALDLHVPAGDFISIVGPSGCGKSTLLRLIAGLESVDGGSVLAEPAPHPGFVFQDPQLLPWRTVVQNVRLPLELRSFPLEERASRALKALEQVGMRAEADLYPSQLSGGMKMRVSLARALVTEPDLLLLDEPFAALDELSRVQLEEELRRLWLARPMTVVLVTHSFSEAVFLSNHVVVLSVSSRKVGEILPISLGERNEALRRTPEFASLVQDCRRYFESSQKGKQ